MVALHYETTGRMLGELESISADMQYWCDHYFDHPNYLGSMADLWSLPNRKLEREGDLESSILRLRTHSIFLVGDHIFESAPSVADRRFHSVFLTL